MYLPSRQRSMRVIALLVSVILISTAAAIVFAIPTIAASICPSCYGMEAIGTNVYVDSMMAQAARQDLRASLTAAEASVSSFFGGLSSRRTILVCSTEVCENRLKSRLEGTARIRAFTYDMLGYPVIRLSPRGLKATLIGQELTHVELHERIGFLNHMNGSFPAWFDEGLAVLIAGDQRYYRSGNSAAERCLPSPDVELPLTPLAWDEAAGKAPWIYTKATCDVMRWMEANGGRAGVLAAIAGVATGRPFHP